MGFLVVLVLGALVVGTVSVALRRSGTPRPHGPDDPEALTVARDRALRDIEGARIDGHRLRGRQWP